MQRRKVTFSLVKLPMSFSMQAHCKTDSKSLLRCVPWYRLLIYFQKMEKLLIAEKLIGDMPDSAGRSP